VWSFKLGSKAAGGMGGPGSRTIRSVGCPRFRFLVPGSWGGRLLSLPAVNQADDHSGNTILRTDRPGTTSYTWDHDPPSVASRTAFECYTIKYYSTVDKFPEIISCEPSGSSLLRAAAFHPLPALSQISPNSFAFRYPHSRTCISFPLLYIRTNHGPGPVGAPTIPSLRFPISIFNFPSS
jgi:hypothetical protein